MQRGGDGRQSEGDWGGRERGKSGGDEGRGRESGAGENLKGGERKERGRRRKVVDEKWENDSVVEKRERDEGR